MIMKNNKKCDSVGTTKATHQNSQANNSTIERLLSILTEFPQSRQTLASKLGISDRSLRWAVESARLHGYLICSNSTQNGYWIGSEEDVRHTIAEYEARGLKALEVARKMKSRQLQGQTKLNV